MGEGKDHDRRANATDRTVMVLSAFAAQYEWGVRELAQYLGLAKSGLHRTLQELNQAGLLAVDETGMYSTAPGLMELAANLIRSTDLTRVARSHLEHARDEGGETTVLTAYDPQRREIIGVDAAESEQPIQFAWRVLREWTPLYIGSGRGILAFLKPSEIDQILSGKLKDADGSWIDVSRLRDELDKARSLGYAVIEGKRAPGNIAVCAPIFGSHDRLLGGAVIAWPTHGSNAERNRRLYQLCKKTAAAISKELGGAPPNTSKW